MTVADFRPERRGRARRPARMSGDERERALLATAERLLGERGLHEISVDDLASGAGLSRSAFYFYFASKEQLLLTLMERLVAQQVEAEDKAWADLAHDPVRVCREVLTASLATWVEHRGVFQAAAQVRRTDPEVGALWERLIASFVERTTQFVEQERARGAAPLSTPARELAVCLVRMNERVFESLTQDSDLGPGGELQRQRTLDTVIAVWLASVYGTVPTAV